MVNRVNHAAQDVLEEYAKRLENVHANRDITEVDVTNHAVRVAWTKRVMCPLVCVIALITSLATSAMTHVSLTAWNVILQLFAHVVKRDSMANHVTTRVVLPAFTIAVTLTVDALVLTSTLISHIAMKAMNKNQFLKETHISLPCP